LTRREDGFLLRHCITSNALVLLGEEIHRIMDAIQVAPFDGQGPWDARADCYTDGIEVPLKVISRDVLAHVDARLENDTLSFHLLHASSDQALFHLEVRDAIGEKSADPIVAFENRYIVPRPSELLGRCQ